ncbi:S8 family serine peptidase [Gilvimarinus japonicus]|uniref:S8 family serine peptidase n=1 Tax=Gilvimarinus japonicus TaxID=1796469 RepID=A0ABV7HRU3_9GAMM
MKSTTKRIFFILLVSWLIVFPSFGNSMDYVKKPSDDKDVKKYQWGLHALDAPSAWELSTGGASIGIVDSYHSYYGDQLSAFKNHRVMRSIDRDSDEILSNLSTATHGLHVAGIAIGNDSDKYKGVCPECSFVSIGTTPKNLSSGGLRALWGGVSVINISAGGDTNTHEEEPFYISEALRREVVVVAASGNNQVLQIPPNSGYAGKAQLPAAYQGVIPVAAAAKIDRLEPGNWGKHIGSDWRLMRHSGEESIRAKECGQNKPSSVSLRNGIWGSRRPAGINSVGVVAPGVNIIGVFAPGIDAYDQGNNPECTWNNIGTGKLDQYGLLSGTSMAVPHVSGVAGLVRTINPLQSNRQTREIIYKSSSTYDSKREEIFDSPIQASVEFQWGINLDKKKCYKIKFNEEGKVEKTEEMDGFSKHNKGVFCETLVAGVSDRIFLSTTKKNNTSGSPEYLRCEYGVASSRPNGIQYCNPWNIDSEEPNNKNREVTNYSGNGMLNANRAVHLALASNPNRLTPLFSLYSDLHRDSFYTVYPQIAIAAIKGEIFQHRSDSFIPDLYSPVGNRIFRYNRFPSVNGYSALSEMWVFTTHHNPYSNVSLAPLRRYVKIINGKIDSFLAIGFDEHDQLIGEGYFFDGTEGYIYPFESEQPNDTIAVYKGISKTSGNEIIFPENLLTEKLALGYEVNTSEVLGYTYANDSYRKPDYPNSLYMKNHPVPLKPSSNVNINIEQGEDGYYRIGFNWTAVNNVEGYRIKIYRSGSGGNPYKKPAYIDAYPTSCNRYGVCGATALFSSPPGSDFLWGVSVRANGKYTNPYFLNSFKRKDK